MTRIPSRRDEQVATFAPDVIIAIRLAIASQESGLLTAGSRTSANCSVMEGFLNEPPEMQFPITAALIHEGRRPL